MCVSFAITERGSQEVGNPTAITCSIQGGKGWLVFVSVKNGKPTALLMARVYPIGKVFAFLSCSNL